MNRHRLGLGEPVSRELANAATRSGWFSLTAMAAGWMLLAGCTTPDASATKPLASVVIQGQTENRIRLLLVEVFGDAHYESRVLYGPELVFEKRGSFTDDLLRGGSLSSKTVVRARVRVEPNPAGGHLLECWAAKVQYPGDRVMEEEFRIHSGGAFQKILTETKRRLEAESAASPPAK